jgi:CHAT domain-containing protein/tetratricopeptide (TPR) repeat protein
MKADLDCHPYFLTIVLVLAFLPAGARTINVPGDFQSIRSAVDSARDGDRIEVEDGYYFEKNIVITKKITIRAKNLFGAIIYGSAESGSSIFIVQAEAEIEGFVLKNSFYGILQRDSPDVLWKGRDLAFLDTAEAVSINDRESNMGRAVLENLIVDNCRAAFITNDAHGLEVRSGLVSRARLVFAGYDHLYFRAEEIVAWNCDTLFHEDALAPPAPATNKISLGNNVLSFDQARLNSDIKKIEPMIGRLFVIRPHDGYGTAKAQKSRQGLLMNLLGDTFAGAGDAAHAAGYFQETLRLARDLNSEELTWHAYYGLARTSELQADLVRASDYYKKAIAIIENISLKLPLHIFRSGFRRDKIGIYEALIQLLLQLHQKETSQGFDREAFYYAEKSKAMGLHTFLQESNLDAEKQQDDGLREQYRTIARNVTRVQIELQRPDLSTERRRTLLQALDKADGEVRDFIVQGRRNDPKYFRLHYVQPSSCEVVRQKLVNADTALLEFVIGARRSFAFLVTRDELAVAALPPEKVLTPLVNNYLKFLTMRESGSFKGAKGGQKLFGVLVAPFQERLGKNIKTVIIVPDGSLDYLPFEALMENSGTSRFLIEDHEILYGASASCLINLRERVRVSTPPMDFLGLANPYPASAYGLSLDQKVRFPRLRSARKEIQTIKNFFRPERTTLLMGQEAEEKKFKELRLADYRIIHLAAHGIIDDWNWWRSAMLLLKDPRNVDDGFLQPTEIYFLRFSPELLVLSGCQTGIGMLEKGEGINGMSSAFFYAGARSILLSLWSVNDKATAGFMEYFYRHLTGGKPAPEALRLAKLQMLESRYAHPFYWAAFVLNGR